MSFVFKGHYIKNYLKCILTEINVLHHLIFQGEMLTLVMSLND